MTKDEFIERWCEKAKFTREEFDERFVAKPCVCGEDICKGWAVSGNDIPDEIILGV